MKNILIVTYYWKGAGGPGVQRWIKFVKYLSLLGYSPTIYTPSNPHYPITDPSIGQDLPTNIKVITHKIIEPHSLASLISPKKTKQISSGIIPPSDKKSLWENIMIWIRGNLFIPDARCLWVRPSVRFLKKYIVENNIDILITTGPPHSLHLIGMNLKKSIPALKWVADFRDPWTNIGYHSQLNISTWANRKHLSLEKKVLTSADLILTTSPSTKAEFSAKTSTPIQVITNGYDDFISQNPNSEPLVPNGKFVISHIGSLLTERNPIYLWKALSQLVAENPNFKKDLYLCLAGKVSSEVLSSLQSYNLTQFLSLRGYISHTDSQLLQQQSSLLLLLEINNPKTQGIIPGKLFEYLSSHSPILALGYHTWDAKNIIEKTHSGVAPSYNNVNDIKTEILNFYNLFKQGNNKISSQNIQKYHRKNLTSTLITILENL